MGKFLHGMDDAGDSLKPLDDSLDRGRHFHSQKIKVGVRRIQRCIRSLDDIEHVGECRFQKLSAIADVLNGRIYLVGNSRRQLPDGLELLREAQLMFSGLTLANLLSQFLVALLEACGSRSNLLFEDRTVVSKGIA